MADSIQIKVTDHGHSYSAMGKNYTIETRGSILISDVTSDKDMVEYLFERAVDSAVHALAQDISKDLVKDFRRLYVKEVNAAVRAHLTKNKAKILEKMTTQAIKDAEAKIEDVYDDY